MQHQPWISFRVRKIPVRCFMQYLKAMCFVLLQNIPHSILLEEGFQLSSHNNAIALLGKSVPFRQVWGIRVTGKTRPRETMRRICMNQLFSDKQRNDYKSIFSTKGPLLHCRLTFIAISVLALNLPLGDIPLLSYWWFYVVFRCSECK